MTKSTLYAFTTAKVKKYLKYRTIFSKKNAKTQKKFFFCPFMGGFSLIKRIIIVKNINVWQIDIY
ncbi:hypothetical protein CIK99_10050 [Prevotella sp. P5-92]|nr:hypothetical protein CIK99_10050 [Prevotella sp. P5-92]